MRELADHDDLLGRLANIGRCGGPTFSPDGQRVAFVSDLSGSPQAWSIATDGRRPERITAFDASVLRASWSPRGDLIAVIAAPGGGMNRQVYTIRPDGSEQRLLTPGGLENNRLGPWTPDGSRLFVTSDLREPEWLDTYLVDVGSGAWAEVARTRGISVLMDVSRDGRRALLRRGPDGNNDLYVIDLDHATERHLTPHGGDATFSNARFASDSMSLYLLTDECREHACFARVGLDDGGVAAVEVVAAREHGLEMFEITDDGTCAALVWNVEGRSEVELYDLQRRESLLRTFVPFFQLGDLCWSPDGARLAFDGWGPAVTTDVHLLDRSDGSIRQVTHSPHLGVDLGALRQPGIEHFTAHDGLPLSGWLYRPARFDPPGPVVLSFHGGPEGQERPVLDRTYCALLEAGIAVFAPNVRGSTGFGRSFQHLDDREGRFDAIRDIGSCVDHIVATGIADPRLIGITGWSYGGYLTMAGITEFPECFAAAVCQYGIVDLRSWFVHTEKWIAAASIAEYGDPDKDGDLLDRLSPINKMDRVRTPTLVIHGANDTNCPLGESKQITSALALRGVPVELIVFPDEGHGFLKPANRTRAMRETVGWFRRYLMAE